MNRPSPSIAILAVIAIALALIFLYRQYLSPAHHAAAIAPAIRAPTTS